MINMDNFMRQHKDIIEELNFIENIVNREDYLKHLDDFVPHINSLAGKLKIHLNSEDKFLYPNLINGQDTELKNMGQEYIDEMGDIANAFINYKNEFNTKSKINNKADVFVNKTQPILKEIRNRILKEENGLYKLIVEKRI